MSLENLQAEILSAKEAMKTQSIAINFDLFLYFPLTGY